MKGVYLKISDKRVDAISEDIINSNLRKNGYKINKNPYLNILPPVKSATEFIMPKFESDIHIEVKSIELRPNIENPHSVVLNLSEDITIQVWRDELIDQVNKQNIIGDINDLEITLIDRVNSEQKLDIESKRYLIQKIESIKKPNYIKATELSEKMPENVPN